MLEKKLYELKIDPEFENAIYPLTEEEFKELEDNIQKNGCTDPLIVWNDYIADGHNRYKICKKHRIPFAVSDLEGCETKEDVMIWMCERALGRRNITDYTKTVLGLTKEKILAEQAQIRKKSGVKIDLESNSTPGSGKGKTRDKIAKMVGKSSEYVYRVKKLEAFADQETKDLLHRGLISVNKAYNALNLKKETSSLLTDENVVRQTQSPNAPTGEQKHESGKKDDTEFDDSYNNTVQMIGKKAIHVEGKMPDVPDSFPVVLDLLDEVKRNYLVSLEHILLQYTPGMVTEEHTKKIRSMFSGAASQATKIINQRILEVTK